MVSSPDKKAGFLQHRNLRRFPLAPGRYPRIMEFILYRISATKKHNRFKALFLVRSNQGTSGRQRIVIPCGRPHPWQIPAARSKRARQLIAGPSA
jgi:hypothetical protein